jgi:hypothetical protein
MACAEIGAAAAERMSPRTAALIAVRFITVPPDSS